MMVKIGLQIKARLEYVSKLNIQDEAYLWVFKKGWRVEVENSHQKFNDVDLTEREWMDYNDCAKVSVGVYELEHRFVKIP
ncbi:unnamed protein product [Notodromas monacha]|uniref:Uncharacterized protein n=1 Tax=Notodromas monacha TaxID=399045 RepID=A0A7R9GJL3_9CRUS|nr:unnamed protein product [Notodromas monacha]CAG0923679.1 unnamed protein product [Notodromas monacha]